MVAPGVLWGSGWGAASSSVGGAQPPHQHLSSPLVQSALDTQPPGQGWAFVPLGARDQLPFPSTEVPAAVGPSSVRVNKSFCSRARSWVFFLSTEALASSPCRGVGPVPSPQGGLGVGSHLYHPLGFKSKHRFLMTRMQGAERGSRPIPRRAGRMALQVEGPAPCHTHRPPPRALPPAGVCWTEAAPAPGSGLWARGRGLPGP